MQGGGGVTIICLIFFPNRLFTVYMYRFLYVANNEKKVTELGKKYGKNYDIGRY